MGLKYLLISLVLMLSGCAQDVVFAADSSCVFGVDKNHIPRVLNPEKCDDVQAVKYLNCWDKTLIPREQRPKECQSD